MKTTIRQGRARIDTHPRAAMGRLLAASLFVACAGPAVAFQPRTGLWWNPNESGSGYNLEVQDGTLVATIYSYETSGAAQWYLASGRLTNNQHNFAGTLDRYAGGQCASCPYTGQPTLTGNDGAISIAFASETSATLTLPGGRVTQIQPFNFGIGEPPSGLLGEWIFVYDLGATTYAERFNLASLQAGTPGGSGLAVDALRIAACELQVSGVLAGKVVCARGDLDANVLSLYVFEFGLDETFSGSVISPPTPAGRLYPMTGFKVRSKSGIARNLPDSANAVSAVMSAGPERKMALDATGSPDAQVPALFRAKFEVLVDAIAAASPGPHAAE